MINIYRYCLMALSFIINPSAGEMIAQLKKNLLKQKNSKKYLLNKMIQNL